VALKDLLVYLDCATRSPVQLRLAVDLARRHASFITALHVREWTAEQLARRRTAELAGRSAADVGELEEAVESSIDRSARGLKATFAGLTGQHGLDSEWRTVEGEPSTVLPQHARYADLCILGAGAPGSSTAGAAYRFSEEMLFTAGRPVLLVPQSSAGTTLGAHVAVAWNSSRSAARALNDALPLLERSETTTVLTVNPGESIEARGGLPARRLLEHLRRHGVAARSVELSAVPDDAIAAALQEKASAAGADLLVAGAHGHTWLREVLLGSVTRDLLSELRLPLMMSH
jgi:nucleotide-binding universal stress UspA family protein